ncbi:MAG: hypothetical protein LH628_25005 [Microcoleus sp. CAN_BIN18]|nr:hypothetical protein [Microcoleus sp. CAN_BIN18]
MISYTVDRPQELRFVVRTKVRKKERTKVRKKERTKVRTTNCFYLADGAD